MKSPVRTTVWYLVAWLAASSAYFYYSGTITKQLFPGYDHVDLWLSVLIPGWAIIFAVVCFLMFYTVTRRLRNRE